MRHPGDDNKRYVDDIAAVCESLFATASAVLADGGLPLVLGGDHSLAAGSVAATAAWARQRGGRIGLIWVDAHGDMNTPGSTTSGNVHGMPLAALIGSEPAELAAVGGFHPKVDPRAHVLIGVRNLDDKEKQRVRDSRIHVFTMMDVDRSGIACGD
jgi:arginase